MNIVDFYLRNEIKNNLYDMLIIVQIPRVFNNIYNTLHTLCDRCLLHFV